MKVFISYAREDRERALGICARLVQDGHSPWIDVNELLPGQNWEAEIERAFKDADVVVLLLSKRSVSKRGFVRREANDAMDRLRYKLRTDVYVIPLLLEPCEVPEEIASRLHYIALAEDGAWERVQAALRVAEQQHATASIVGESFGPFQVFTEKLTDKWLGAPGHDIEIAYPRLESSSCVASASELTRFFAGRACDVMVSNRQKPWAQIPSLSPDEMGALGSNGRWDSFAIAHATSAAFSLRYEVDWYGAGAAHPNSHFETYNFVIGERVVRLQLRDFFSDLDAAVSTISRNCVQALSREWYRREGAPPDAGQEESFIEGAGADAKNFQTFTVGPAGLNFLFAPYEVAAYAFGSWSAEVSFYDLRDSLWPTGPHKVFRGDAV